MHPNHIKVCESVDASVFNGELLYTGLEEFKSYLARWTRAVARHEQLHCTGCGGAGVVGGLTPQGYETEPCPFCSDNCMHGVNTQYYCIECEGDHDDRT